MYLEILNKTCKQTKSMPQPCEPRTAISCVILDQVFQNFIKFQPKMLSLCMRLREELYKSVFTTPPELDAKPLSANTDASQAVVDVLASKFMVGTWFDRAREFEKMWEAVRSEGSSAAEHVAELQKTLRYWKDAYLRKVFTAWRQYSSQQKGLRMELNQLKAQMAKDADRIRQLEEENEMLMESKQRYLKLQSELQQERDKNSDYNLDIKTWKHKEDEYLQEIHQANMQIAKLEERIRQLEGSEDDVKNLQEELAGVQKHYVMLGKTLFKAIKAIEGPAHESNLRSQLMPMIEKATRPYNPKGGADASNTLLMPAADPFGGLQFGTDSKQKFAPPDAELLIEWANYIIKLHPAAAGNPSKYVLNDLTGGFRMLDSYLCLINMLAPDFLGTEECDKVLKDLDNAFKVETILETLKKMGIETNLSEPELLSEGGNTEYAHWVLLSSLFRRFADSMVSLSAGNKPFKAPTIEEMRAAADVDYGTTAPETWQKKVDEAIGYYCRWQNTAQSLLNSVNGKMIHRLRGGKGTLSKKEQEELRRFTALKAIRLDDILPKKKEQADEWIEKLIGILTEHYDVLKRVYKYYCSSDTASIDALMSGHEFWRFASDAKVVDKKALNRAGLRRIFFDVNSKTDKGEDPAFNPYIGYDTDSTLTPTEWAEALIRIANIRYKDNFPDLPHRMNHLIENNIIPNCLQVVIDEFKQQVFSPRVQQALKNYRKYLVDVFKAYAKSDVRDVSPEMNFNEFKRMLDDSAMIDEVFTHYAAQHIFIKIQDDDDLSLTMMFHEFQQAVVAIAAFKNPAPYLPLHQRLQSFLEVSMLPPLAHKFPWTENEFKSKAKFEISMPSSGHPAPKRK
eukprot:TRINITY_DN60868_c0_g1_i2.p1 TRINITY_DN60868_c0_g1~~TRINITY_DN60868_c0_g1_i2.p1  ORF type:complete len:850 (-),score=96.67 TRINITY_DN60868_c0_g1_i2:1353-3902(-)